MSQSNGCKLPASTQPLLTPKITAGSGETSATENSVVKRHQSPRLHLLKFSGRSRRSPKTKCYYSKDSLAKKRNKTLRLYQKLSPSNGVKGME